MNLLITGGAGFVGSSLVRRVINEGKVDRLVTLDCLTYAGHLENLAEVLANPRHHFEQVDLRDAAAVADVVTRHEITHVVHLAAESHVDRSIADPGAFVHTNVVGTYHLLEACRRTWGGNFDGRKFLHASTDEVYGSLGASGRFTERTAYAPNSPYAATKAGSDLLARSYHQTYGLPVVITNGSNNYGPYQHPEKLMPLAIQRAFERQAIPVYGDGRNVRDWLYVTDHAEALWQVLLRGRQGESYNIGGNNERTNLRVVEMICDLVDEYAPRLGGGSRRLIAFVEDRAGHDRRYAIDATKVRTELGWSPVYSFGEGLRLTVRWYLSHQDWVRTVRTSPHPNGSRLYRA
jgi:dTDP-glucose 4,6-dehydratase